MSIAPPSDLVRAIGADLASLPTLTAPAIRAVRRRWSESLRTSPGSHVVSIARELARSATFPARFVAYELVAHHRGAMAAIRPPHIVAMARGLADWASVDTFATLLAGPLWREGQLPSKVMDGWADSPDRWMRRLSLACAVTLNVKARGGSGDAKRTLALCRRAVDDRDDMVVKALSWALRSLAPVDPRAVQGFLATYDERLAARVKREVRLKLHTGTKSGRSAASRSRRPAEPARAPRAAR